METSLNTIEIHLDFTIQDEISNVWKCLIQDVSQWWKKDFHTSPDTKKMIIEPKVGGRMYEDYGNEEGLLWATVIGLKSPHYIEFKGHLTPHFGGPAISFLKLSLTKNDNATILTLTDSVMGQVTERSKKSLTDGWQLIYGDGFKKYAESKK